VCLLRYCHREDAGRRRPRWEDRAATSPPFPHFAEPVLGLAEGETRRLHAGYGRTALEGVSMRLNDKVAIVTGAGSGMGAAIAETFAREGARVGVLDIDADAAKTVARRIGTPALALGCDVAKSAEIDAAIRSSLAAFGRIDILVNNAGIAHVNKPVTEIGEDELDRVLAVNVKGVFLFSQAMVPVFRG